MKHNDGFYTQLLSSRGVESAVVKAAKVVQAEMERTAPVDTGEFKSSFRTRTKRQKRVVAVVESTDPDALIIEARTGTMVRAVRAVGRRG